MLTPVSGPSAATVLAATAESRDRREEVRIVKAATVIKDVFLEVVGTVGTFDGCLEVGWEKYFATVEGKINSGPGICFLATEIRLFLFGSYSHTKILFEGRRCRRSGGAPYLGGGEDHLIIIPRAVKASAHLVGKASEG